MKKILLAIMLFEFCFSIFAWWGTGHELVGYIAEKNLTPEAKVQSEKYLNDIIIYPGNEEIAKCSMTYSDANTWCDNIKDSTWKNDENNSTCSMFHYINPEINPGEKVTKKDINRAFSKLLRSGSDLSKYNSYITLLSSIKTIKSPKCSEAEKAVAFRFILHLTGDIHMPFHNLAPIINGINTRGGNEIVLKTPVTANVIPPPEGQTTTIYNMHALWDSGAGFCSQLPYSKEIMPVTESQEKYLSDTSDMIINSEKDKEHIKFKLKDPVIRHWMIRSALIAANSLNSKYVSFSDDPENPGKKVIVTFKNEPKYLNAVKTACKSQIYLAGKRQAKLLNAIFDPNNADKDFVEKIQKICNEKRIPFLHKLFPDPIKFELKQQL